jgi:hypothetical protein
MKCLSCTQGAGFTTLDEVAALFSSRGAVLAGRQLFEKSLRINVPQQDQKAKKKLLD